MPRPVGRNISRALAVDHGRCHLPKPLPRWPSCAVPHSTAAFSGREFFFLKTYITVMAVRLMDTILRLTLRNGVGGGACCGDLSAGCSLRGSHRSDAVPAGLRPAPAHLQQLLCVVCCCARELVFVRGDCDCTGDGRGHGRSFLDTRTATCRALLARPTAFRRPALNSM